LALFGNDSRKEGGGAVEKVDSSAKIGGWALFFVSLRRAWYV